MKLTNVGRKSSDKVSPGKEPKIYYPEFRVEQKIGELEVGDEVTLVVKAKVSAERQDEYGYSMSFQVQKVGLTDTSAEDKISKEVNKILS